eukprot:CAMPEP_0170183144 /NCGR_PEP_ID=MMETSP0040_2-20121228/29759_1 /TAXON_ID=641309 /ORGANISM="Lotharella oceanica, Strain CCMP622" /LENGTH=320 /DNA_ID=CAMNT_0010428783 /DNA_START=524 /DNA_END=1487 /DNA_ORIENTATION=+
MTVTVNNFQDVEFESVEDQKVEVVGNLTLDDIIADKLKKPLDLKTFAHFCRKEFCEEHLYFVLVVRNFKKLKPTGEAFTNAVQQINARYIEAGAEEQINISASTQKKVIKDTKALKEPADGTTEADAACYKLYDKAEEEILQVLENDAFRRYKGLVSVSVYEDATRAQALWCFEKNRKKETPTCMSFFNYPNPIDAGKTRQARIIMTILLLCAGVEFYFNDSCWILVAQTALMVLRVLCGSRLDGLTLLVLYTTDPIMQKLGWFKISYVKNKARRFADGFMLCGFILCLGLCIFSLEIPFWVFWGCMVCGHLLHALSDDI